MLYYNDNHKYTRLQTLSKIIFWGSGHRLLIEKQKYMHLLLQYRCMPTHTLYTSSYTKKKTCKQFKLAISFKGPLFSRHVQLYDFEIKHCILQTCKQFKLAISFKGPLFSRHVQLYDFEIKHCILQSFYFFGGLITNCHACENGFV